MARRPSCLAGLLAVLACLGAAAVADGLPTRFLVKFAPSSGDQVRKELEAKGFVVRVDLELSSTFAVEEAPAPSPAAPRESRLAAAAALAGPAEAAPALPPPPEAAIKEQAAKLGAIPGVVAVGQDRLMRLLKPAKPSSSACAADTVRQAGGGGGLETTPYGITSTQADDPVMLEVAARYATKNILYCVIDSGVDATHPDLKGAKLQGCSPKAPSCKYRWDADVGPPGSELFGHGTHVTGTIAAARNGFGVVGAVGAGAQVFHYNIFGPRESVWMSETGGALAKCAAALDRLQRANPSARAVVSMSFGAPASPPGWVPKWVRAPVERDPYLTSLYARGDMLFFAAAGNDGDASLSYPAGYPEVVSVASTDPSNRRSNFSNYNANVEIAAPGSAVLSTLALLDRSARVAGASLRSSPELPSPVSLAQPATTVLSGSGIGTVAAPLADCGLGLERCASAAGKVCLIERGTNFFCEKVANCVAGGGVAVAIYNKPDTPKCEETLVDATLIGGSCLPPSRTYPPTVGLTRAQGQALLALLAAGAQQVNATVHVPSPDSLPPYGFKSGTSMATPLAAGIAGLVWAQWPGCSNEVVRKALAAGAMDLSSKGRDVYYGFGIIQARASYDIIAALPCARASRRTPPPAARRSPPRKLLPPSPRRLSSL